MPDSPATHFAESMGMYYRLIQHPPGIRTAVEFAEATGIPINRVFKTLLLKSKDGRYILCSLPSEMHVDTEKLSELCGYKKLSMASKSEIPQITGYALNTVSPLGARSAIPYFIDSHVKDGDRVYFGSGIAGYDIEVNVQEFLSTMQSNCADFAYS